MASKARVAAKKNKQSRQKATSEEILQLMLDDDTEDFNIDQPGNTPDPPRSQSPSNSIPPYVVSIRPHWIH